MTVNLPPPCISPVVSQSEATAIPRTRINARNYMGMIRNALGQDASSRGFESSGDERVSVGQSAAGVSTPGPFCDEPGDRPTASNASLDSHAPICS